MFCKVLVVIIILCVVPGFAQETEDDDRPWWLVAQDEEKEMKKEDAKIMPVVFPSLPPVTIHHEAVPATSGGVYSALFYMLLSLFLVSGAALAYYCFCKK